jgi:hypothetical protein
MKLYMFQTVTLPIVRSLFSVHSALVYVIQALYTQLSSRSIFSCSTAVCTLSETCRASWQNKFVTMHGHMNVLSRCTVTWTYCQDARSHERIVTMQHGHMNVLSRCSTVTWTYCQDARSHERSVTMHGHMNVLSRCMVTWTYCEYARSHERIVNMHGHKLIVKMHGHMNVLSRFAFTWTYCHDARSHKLIVTMHGHINVLSRCMIT